MVECMLSKLLISLLKQLQAISIASSTDQELMDAFDNIGFGILSTLVDAPMAANVIIPECLMGHINKCRSTKDLNLAETIKQKKSLEMALQCMQRPTACLVEKQYLNQIHANISSLHRQQVKLKDNTDDLIRGFDSDLWRLQQCSFKLKNAKDREIAVMTDLKQQLFQVSQQIPAKQFNWDLPNPKAFGVETTIDFLESYTGEVSRHVENLLNFKTTMTHRSPEDIANIMSLLDLATSNQLNMKSDSEILSTEIKIAFNFATHEPHHPLGNLKEQFKNEARVLNKKENEELAYREKLMNIFNTNKDDPLMKILYSKKKNKYAAAKEWFDANDTNW